MNWKCKFGKHDWVKLDKEDEITRKIKNYLKSKGFERLKKYTDYVYSNGIIDIYDNELFDQYSIYNIVRSYNTYSKVCIRCMKVEETPFSCFTNEIDYIINKRLENLQRKQFAERVLDDHHYIEENKRKGK